MKKKYYVSTVAQANGDHEVHAENCIWMPKSEHKKFLGDYENCAAAVTAARVFYNQVNGCRTCSNACHTQ